ncbi:MAG: 2-hydroxyglutaryl-CoA dehydratase [Desulfobacteraceae bacterium]|nr:2-hydroxyglutaryl-CoA dehydratase [Desulfobacteraceae bacterium]MBC2755409.1 2-hydroxyglutaryl-CoA dehydratase [Desulfobacteraceae bacterium]
MIVAGVDVGSLSGEAVIMSNGNILSQEIIRVRPLPEQTANDVTIKALESAKLSLDDIDYCVSTGYGREMIPFANGSISEISCHGKGAFWATPSVRTVIDIGGQDCKVIRVDDKGNLLNFMMNDKCAAGTGRFLEVMAKTLGVELRELGPLALESKAPTGITSICSIICQFEVMMLLNEGKDRPDIAAGISKAMARRVMRLVKGVGKKSDVALTGGVAKNPAVVKSLQEFLEMEIVKLDIDPQIVGALGAALVATERLKKKLQKETI